MARPHRRNTAGPVGEDAERHALEHLLQHGLTLVARNFRSRRGEIDIVMLDENCLVFVEVRSRNRNSFVNARLTVDARKQRKLASAALLFLARHPRFDQYVCRFDVVGVDRDADGTASLDWIRDAFRPSA